MPPKKGKGKGKKKKKENLTEEQKKKAAEQKALAEQEKIARRREVTNAFLKLKKEKEYGLIKLNMNKLLDVWRPRLRKLKIEELLEDYELMRNAFERAFDKKNQLMLELRDALDKNQADYDAAVDSHMHNIDKMMEFWKKRLTEVRESYNRERSKLIHKLTEEMNRIQKYQTRSIKQLQDSTNSVTDHFKEQSSEAKTDFRLREEDIRNKGMEEIHYVKSRMDQRMNFMWNDLQERLVSYDVSVGTKRAEYIEYRDKDAAMSQLIDSQFNRLQFLKDGIAQVTTKTAMFEKALNHHLLELTKKKSEYRDDYNQMMKTHHKLLAMSSAAIRCLAIKTSEVHKRMDTMIARRERLLRLMERCRQRERMDEKLDPFLVKWKLGGEENRGSTRVYELPGEGEEEYPLQESEVDPSMMDFNEEYMSPEFDDQCQGERSQVSMDADPELLEPLQNLVQEFSVLEKFWIRYNRVSLERAALGVRRETLLKDNLHLKIAIRNYMGGLNPIMHDINTVHQDVMVMNDMEPPLSPTSSSIVPTSSRFAAGGISPRASADNLPGTSRSIPKVPRNLKSGGDNKVTFPRFVRAQYTSSAVVDGVQAMRTLEKSVKALQKPGQTSLMGEARLPRLLKEQQQINRMNKHFFHRNSRCPNKKPSDIRAR